MKRSRTDPVYADEVWRRYQRRRNLPSRQFEAAVQNLKDEFWAAVTPWLEPIVVWLARRLP